MNDLVIGGLVFFSLNLFFGLFTPFIGARVVAHPIVACYVNGFVRNVLSLIIFFVLVKSLGGII